MKDNSIVILFKVMRWVIRTIFVIVGVIPLSRCSSGYKEKNGKVTFNGKEIDGKGFVVLNRAFAKNDSTVYYKERAFEYADVATFVALDEHYAKDKDKAYYCDEYREGQNYYLTKKQTILTIENAIPASFEYLQDDYARDGSQAYYKGIAFKVKDVASLTVIGGRFLKDQYQVYFEKNPVKNADVHSFRILNGNYASDTNRIYYYGFHNDANNGIHEIPCNRATFSLLEYPYAKDNETAFYVYTKISGSDAGSFSVLGNGYSKDKNHVYIEAKVLVGADPVSFTTFTQEGSLEDVNYTKDNKHAFYKDKMLKEVNIESFKILGLGYATDGKRVYFHTSTVKNADPATFKVYEHGFGDADAEDAKHKYSEGTALPLR